MFRNVSEQIPYRERLEDDVVSATVIRPSVGSSHVERRGPLSEARGDVGTHRFGGAGPEAQVFQGFCGAIPNCTSRGVPSALTVSTNELSRVRSNPSGISRVTR